jgi:hypothetical protein
MSWPSSNRRHSAMPNMEGGSELLARLCEELDNRHRGYIPCVEYKDDGSMCRQRAIIFDRKRQRMVCQDHDPQHQVRVLQPAPARLVAPAPASEVVLPDDTQPSLFSGERQHPWPHLRERRHAVVQRRAERCPCDRIWLLRWGM